MQGEHILLILLVFWMPARCKDFPCIHETFCGVSARALQPAMICLSKVSAMHDCTVPLQAAVMCAGDLFAAHGSRVLPLLDTGGSTQPAKSMLAQLLLKSGSNDKKFVIDEVQRALAVMAANMDPPAIMGRLLPYAAHKNPKVCARSNSMSARVLSQMLMATLLSSAAITFVSTALMEGVLQCRRYSLSYFMWHWEVTLSKGCRFSCAAFTRRAN